MFNHKSLKNKPKNSKAQPLDSVPSFIRKTYEILEENKFPDYIDWNTEGTAIIIKMPAEFAQKVLPTYFKHNNLTSFVRQLNMYNFHKKRTQNLDNIYFHELFQRGKKHLLKEIKRKNHDTQLPPEKSPLLYHSGSQNLTDTLSENQNPGDLNSLSYENQFLKKLYNDAMAKAVSLENQVKELTAQNQSLWSQVCQLKGQSTPTLTHSTASCYDGSRKSSIALDRQHSDLTTDQLPMTMGDVCIPPLKLENISAENQQFNNNLKVNNNSRFIRNPTLNINSYLSFTEDSTTSSDASPSLQYNNCLQSDKEMMNSVQGDAIPQLNRVAITPQMQSRRPYTPVNTLRASRQDVSLGHILENWNEDTKQEEDLLFTKEEECSQDGDVLGKREMEGEGREDFCDQEPALKRNGFESLNIFGRKMISDANDDKEALQMMMVRRESEFNEDTDMNANVDLMDFNGNGLYSWTKAI